MFQLKPLTKEAIPKALERAERYRFLNEPVEAESICNDVLLIEPDNQQALVVLLLALSDQFGKGIPTQDAKEILPKLSDDYRKIYYAGLICERAANAYLDRGSPGSGYAAYEEFRQAMTWYEKAEKLRPAGNDDALLRWNTCVRTIQRHHLQPAPEPQREQPLE